MTHIEKLRELAAKAQAFKTERIERAIKELDVSFVTVDVCGADANAVAQYVRRLEQCVAALRAALDALEKTASPLPEKAQQRQEDE